MQEILIPNQLSTVRSSDLRVANTEESQQALQYFTITRVTPARYVLGRQGGARRTNHRPCHATGNLLRQSIDLKAAQAVMQLAAALPCTTRAGLQCAFNKRGRHVTARFCGKSHAGTSPTHYNSGCRPHHKAPAGRACSLRNAGNCHNVLW